MTPLSTGRLADRRILLVGCSEAVCRRPEVIDLGVVTLGDGVVLGLNNRNLGVDSQVAQTAVETMPRQLNETKQQSILLIF